MSCVPEGPLLFDAVQWEYFTSPNNALGASNATELGLIPDDLYDVGVAVFYAEGIEIPYTVSFEYMIFDEDGAENGNLFNSADGIVLMIAKDAAPYAAMDPPGGGSRGFITDGTGYGIDFSIFGSRTISIRSGDDTVVAGPVTPTISTYPHGQWREVSITVTTAGIDVTYEGALELSHVAMLDETYNRIAFGAGTGGSDGAHHIRNVEITCP